MNQRRRDVQIQSRRAQFGHGEQANAIAELGSVTQIGRVDSINAAASNLAPAWTNAESQLRENRQLLHRVAAIDIHRRIGFGVAAALGVGQGGGIARAAIFHLREDEIAGAVQDAVDRNDLIRGQTLIDVGNDRNSAGHGRLECDRAICFPSGFEQFRAMLGQKGLVGRDDVFAARQQFEHDRAGRFQSANQMGHDGDFRVAGIRFKSEEIMPTGRRISAHFLRVAHHDLLQHEPVPAAAQFDRLARSAGGRRPSRRYRIRRCRF